MCPESPLETNLQDRLRRLNEIGVALSAERDLHALLRLILLEARLFTRADAGTLYLVGQKVLTFEITQNETKRLLEPYSVEVSVQSELGVGTTFTLEIPLDQNT
jgi:GAF domain-containing protein